MSARAEGEGRLIHRLLKFYSVGFVGIGVQAGMLALLTRVLGLHYLIAVALAVECTILHNFIWHQEWTFRQRRRPGASFLVRFLRFNLSAGASALLGNLLVTALLVEVFALPVLPANLAAIAACSVFNYLASDLWVFRRR
ncbi:MAG TPA: GtrA family protein [Acidobacteriota bacterium]|nr:GtrA family protein [Acidobacteriota bacterium]